MASEHGSGRATAAPPDPAQGPATPPKAGLPQRMLPKTALGLAGLIFCMSIAAAFTGAVLYAFYEYRLGETEERVDAFELRYAEQVEESLDRIADERDEAVAQVQSQLDELQRFAASGETLASVLEGAQPSVWFVSTRDEAGQPSVGSAFVVFADSEQSFLLTSYHTVRANTAEPAPGITARKGDEELGATLLAWDPPNDLALLALDRPGLPALTWAPTDSPLRLGDRVFAISGLGAAGGAISQGFVADTSANGIQHDAPIGAAFQGGPLLNSAGEVVGVASRAYSPLGFQPEAVFFGVPVRNACAEVVRCPEGDAQPS